MTSSAFVTGATGFIGRRLVRQLLDEAWHVRALVPSEQSLPLPPRVEQVRGDITDPASLRGTMDDIDAVFHLAAITETWTRNPRDYARVNVAGTDHMIDEAIRASVWRFIFTSSLAGIGVGAGKVLGETSPPGKVFGPRDASKALAEQHVATATRENGLPAIALIPSLVIGPGDVRNTGKFLLSYLRGEYPGTFAEDSSVPVVGVGDVARAHLLAYGRGRVGQRYIISARNTTWGELMRFTSRAAGVPSPSRHIGAKAFWLASRTSELMSLFTRAPPRVPAWLADFLLAGAKVDNSKSIRELGMTYRPVSESIREAIEWFREEGLLKPAPPAPSPRGFPRLPVENPPVGPPVQLPSDVPESLRGDPSAPRRPKPPEKSA